jgi:glycosyltransferase involved in cell wall biosynthesis
MKNALVSVIIPTFNYGHYIGNALDCILAQTFQNWECVIVDDGSIDNTKEVLSRYLNADRRIRYIYQDNQGVSAARNTGIRNSTGEYIQFLDADDLIERRKIEKQVEFLELFPKIDIVYGRGQYFTMKDREGHPPLIVSEEINWIPVIQGNPRSALLALIHRPFFIHSALIRRSIFETVGYFDEKMNSCEDWYLWILCVLNGKFIRYEEIEGTTALYRRHRGSFTSNSEMLFEGVGQFRKEIKKIVRDPQALFLNQRLAAEYEGYMGILYVKKGRILSGMWQCLKAGAASQVTKEKFKWWYCAIAAPFAPRDKFQQIVTFSIGQSIRTIIRHHFRIAS